MARKSVAVLDVRSSEVAVLVGERGVNHTIAMKAIKSEAYEGYDETGAFYDENAFLQAVFSAVSAVEQVCGERVKELFVGVPGAFVELRPKQRDISFPKRRKISERELDYLFESAKEEVEGYRFIRASSMVYVTADNRRVVNPIGLSCNRLSGLLSYFYCRESLVTLLEKAFLERKIKLNFIPSELAQSNCLIPSETRDEYAIFIDVGYLSTTVGICLGNGMVARRSIWVGRGQIALRLMNAFQLPYEAALSLLSKVSLYRKSPVGAMEFNWKNQSYDVHLEMLNEQVRLGLDDICEALDEFLSESAGAELDYKTAFVTGDGLCDIRGALEHMSKRLNRVCEEVSPNLPYYNKPSASSKIALVDMAQDDSQRRGFIYRILNGLGG